MSYKVLHTTKTEHKELFLGIDTIDDVYSIGIGNDDSGEAHSIDLTFQQLVELRLALNKIVSW